jgi:hypothetical protein
VALNLQELADFGRYEAGSPMNWRVSLSGRDVSRSIDNPICKVAYPQEGAEESGAGEGE